jgi:hypothetical protein
MSNDVSIVRFQGTIPARTSIMRSEAFLSQAAPGTSDIINAYAEALQQPVMPDTSIEELYNVPLYWFLQAIDRNVAGDAVLSEAMSEAQTTTTAYMRCIEENPGKYATCSVQVDPDYQGYETQDTEG